MRRFLTPIARVSPLDDARLNAHQHRLSRVVILMLVDVRQIAAISRGDERFEQHVHFQASQHMPTPRAHQQALLESPAVQEQPQTGGFALSARTESGITDQMRSTFDQQHQADLRKDSRLLGVSGTDSTVPSMASRRSPCQNAPDDS